MKAIAIGLFLGALTPGFQDQAPRKDFKDRKWVEGRIVCAGCTLSNEFGTNAQCTLHAKHAQGFLDMDGRLWTLVDNARGHAVITQPKLRDKPIRVFGWVLEKHRHIELWKYEIQDGDKWIGYDYCKT